MNQTSASSGWYFAAPGSADSERSGPVSWSELQELARSGELTSAHVVWHPSLPGWVGSAELAGLLPAGGLSTREAGDEQTTAEPVGSAAAAAGRSRRRLVWALPLAVLVLAGVGLGIYFGLFWGDDEGSAATGGSASTTAGVTSTAPATTATTARPTTTVAPSTTTSRSTTTTTAPTTTTLPGPREGDRRPAVIGEIRAELTAEGMGPWTTTVTLEDGTSAPATFDLPDETTVGMGMECVVEYRDGGWVIVEVE